MPLEKLVVNELTTVRTYKDWQGHAKEVSRLPGVLVPSCGGYFHTPGARSRLFT